MAQSPTAPKRPFTRLERLISRISRHGLFSRCWVICTVGSTSRRVYSKTCRGLELCLRLRTLPCLYVLLFLISLTVNIICTMHAYSYRTKRKQKVR